MHQKPEPGDTPIKVEDPMPDEQIPPIDPAPSPSPTPTPTPAPRPTKPTF